ncbi:MAG: hypothetical protein IPI72_11805 [Flavobacteriales bacterium]|nr:hypothetical protein [Flavobacteriales bacterium]
MGKPQTIVDEGPSDEQLFGEEWDKVDLSLSSGNPTLGGVITALSPWTLVHATDKYGAKDRRCAQGAQ